jgi:hypothetical protein
MTTRELGDFRKALTEGMPAQLLQQDWGNFFISEPLFEDESKSIHMRFCLKPILPTRVATVQDVQTATEEDW